MQGYGHPSELKRPAVLAVVGCAAVAICLHYFLAPLLPDRWRSAGSPELYVLGLAGTLLVLIAAAFSLAKRGGRAATPRPWFVAHILAGSLGSVLIALHGAGHWTGPPALLVLLLFFLVAQGCWARIKAADHLARIMASNPTAFAPADPAARASLKPFIAAKQGLLAGLDGNAEEATCSPTLAHWLGHPLRVFAYGRLARREARVLGAHRSANPLLSNWRWVHMTGAWLLVAGLIAHVIIVTFFAGYAADGAEINWWHLAE